MNDLPPTAPLPDEIIERFPCNDMKKLMSKYEKQLNIYIALAAAVVGFSVFISVLAPVRQQSILDGQRRIIDKLQTLQVDVRVLSIDLQRHSDRVR